MDSTNSSSGFSIFDCYINFFGRDALRRTATECVESERIACGVAGRVFVQIG